LASDNIQNQIRTAIQAAQSGNKGIARHILEEVIKEAPENEAAWMWLASVVDTPDERRACLQRVLEINPDNERAQQALSKLPTSPYDEAPEFDLAARLAADEPRIPSAPAQPAPPTGRTARPERPSAMPARETPPAPDQRDVLAAQRLAAREAELRGGRQRRGLPPALFALVALLAIGMIGAGIYLLWQDTQSEADDTPTPTEAADVLTATPTLVFGASLGTSTPTSTPLPTVTLPPTWTPSVTPTETPPPTATATPLPLESYMLLASGKRAGNTRWELYALRGDGSQEQKVELTLPAASEGEETAGLALLEVYDAAFSFDGNQIAGTARISRGSIESEEVFIAPASGGEIRLVTSVQAPSIENVSWSPDGQQLVYASNGDGDYDIYIVPVAGGEPVMLTNNDAEDRDPAWSPKGDVIVFASDLQSPSELEIWRITPQGQGLKRMTDAEYSSFAPAWSPDGESIAFLSNRRQNTDLYVMTADGTGERALIVRDVPREERDPAWSPDSEWISFSSNREGPIFDLYMIRPDGSDLRRVTEREGDTRYVVWHP
jgi:hypothetical protein